MREYGLGDLDKFLRIADENSADSDILLSERWPKIVAGKARSAYHFASLGIDNLVGLAFAQNAFTEWHRLLAQRLDHNVTMLPLDFLPGPGAFVADLVASLTTRRTAPALLIARRTLDVCEQLNSAIASSLVAEILALFIEVNTERARYRASYLREQCKRRVYDRSDSERYSAWADAAICSLRPR